MAIFKHGNMWDVYDDVDLFCITTNSTVKKNGALVMGKGIAKEARDKFPGIDQYFGTKIQLLGRTDKHYYLITNPNWAVFKPAKIAAFQVKYHYSSRADIDLIIMSTIKLLAFLSEQRGTVSVALNFPGIGNGRLPMCRVYNIVKYLPDTVSIWTKQPVDLTPCMEEND